MKMKKPRKGNISNLGKYAHAPKKTKVEKTKLGKPKKIGSAASVAKAIKQATKKGSLYVD